MKFLSGKEFVTLYHIHFTPLTYINVCAMLYVRFTITTVRVRNISLVADRS